MQSLLKIRDLKSPVTLSVDFVFNRDLTFNLQTVNNGDFLIVGIGYWATGYTIFFSFDYPLGLLSVFMHGK